MVVRSLGPRCGHRPPQAGFTYVGVLIAIAVIGVGLTTASEVWVATANRQKYVALNWAGQQYVEAIGRYYQSSPGSVKIYPMELTDLLEDRRFLSMRRHLRTLYPNPFTHRVDWTPIRAADGTVRGVTSSAAPQDYSILPRSFVYSSPDSAKN